MSGQIPAVEHELHVKRDHEGQVAVWSGAAECEALQLFGPGEVYLTRVQSRCRRGEEFAISKEADP